MTGFLSLTSFSCVKTKYAATAPGLAVYKTKGDYFNNAFFFKFPNGDYGIMDYYSTRYNSLSRFKVIGNDTVYTGRVKLIDGYVLAAEWGKDDMTFLNWTMNQYLDYEIKYQTEMVPIDTLEAHILDSNPFTELYYDPRRPRKFELSDSAEINQIIKNGELEKYFKRLK